MSLCRLLPKPTEGDLLSQDKVICNLSVSGHLLDSRRRVRLIHLDKKQHDCTYLHISDRSDQEWCQSSRLRRPSVVFWVNTFHCRLFTYLIPSCTFFFVFVFVFSNHSSFSSLEVYRCCVAIIVIPTMLQAPNKSQRQYSSYNWVSVPIAWPTAASISAVSLKFLCIIKGEGRANLHWFETGPKQWLS